MNILPGNTAIIIQAPFRSLISLHMGFPGGSVVKNLPTMQEMQETRVLSLGWENPLEEGMVTHSNILAWGILWTEDPGGLQSKGSQRVGHSWSNLACIHACFTSFAKVIYVYCDILGIMEIKNNDGEKNTIMILIPGNKSY